MWLHFDLGATLDYPIFLSLTCLLSFCEGSHDFCRDNLRGFPLYLWDTPWRFIPITCTDPLSLMMLAWKDLRVSHSSNCCYFGSLSAWYFYIFPAFYCFPSWKTSIGGNVFVFTLCRFLCPGLRAMRSYPHYPFACAFLQCKQTLH